MILSFSVAVIHFRTSGLASSITTAPPPIATVFVTTATVAPVDNWPNSFCARVAARSPRVTMVGPIDGSDSTAFQTSPAVPSRGPISPVPGAGPVGVAGAAGAAGAGGGAVVDGAPAGTGGRFSSSRPPITCSGTVSAFIAVIARI